MPLEGKPAEGKEGWILVAIGLHQTIRQFVHSCAIVARCSSGCCRAEACGGDKQEKDERADLHCCSPRARLGNETAPASPKMKPPGSRACLVRNSVRFLTDSRADANVRSWPSSVHATTRMMLGREALRDH